VCFSVNYRLLLLLLTTDFILVVYFSSPRTAKMHAWRSIVLSSLRLLISIAMELREMARSTFEWPILSIKVSILFWIHTLSSFSLNVTTLHSGICYRIFICLSSVIFMRHTQPVEIFGNVSMPLCILADIRAKFYEVVLGEPLCRGR